jgi:ATP-dependent DNA helicase RecG
MTLLDQKKRNQSFDEEICQEQALAELDLAPLVERFAARGKLLNEEKLKNLKLIALEQGTLWPTQGLVLLLGALPHVVVKCARFKGTDMRVFLDRKEYGGELLGQLEQAEGFIKNHIHLRGEINGLQRTDTYELPEEALREALVNALVHRDYTNQGRDIKVGVYDDVVNVVSPGGLPSTLTAETLLDGRSEIRNRVIARVFKELGYIEQWGSGIGRIRSACLDWGLAEPRIEEKGDFVDVEFYRPEFEGVENRSRPITTDYDRFDVEAQTILIFLQDHGRITRKEAKEILSVGDTKIKEMFNSLIASDAIERRGSGRSTYYTRVKA